MRKSLKLFMCKGAPPSALYARKISCRTRGLSPRPIKKLMKSSIVSFRDKRSMKALARPMRVGGEHT